MSKKKPVVVITGASSGIGRATALRFARQGASLVLASRGGEALRDLAAEIETLGAEALAVPTDVADQAAVERLAHVAVARFGRIDVWVNNAGIAVFSRFLTVPLDDFRQVIDVNLMGYVYGSRAALEVMVKQGTGSIVNVASIAGEVPMPFASSYNVSKAGVRALGATIGQELMLEKKTGIHVSTVLPATVDTPFFAHAGNLTGRELRALPPTYAPEAIAAAIVSAVRRPKSEIVVGAAGKTAVAQHRRTPLTVEKQFARAVDTVQLAKKTPAPATKGIMYEPAPPSTTAVAGGWGGKTQTAARVLTGTVLLAGGAAAVLLSGRRK
jgi:short-subunit dehydrogenase